MDDRCSLMTLCSTTRQTGLWTCLIHSYEIFGSRPPFSEIDKRGKKHHEFGCQTHVSLGSQRRARKSRSTEQDQSTRNSRQNTSHHQRWDRFRAAPGAYPTSSSAPSSSCSSASVSCRCLAEHSSKSCGSASINNFSTLNVRP